MNIVVDGCGLEPPEPFELAMDALLDLSPEDSLIVLLDRVPHPLLRILERDGFPHVCRTDDAGMVTLLIAPPGGKLPEESEHGTDAT